MFYEGILLICVFIRLIVKENIILIARVFHTSQNPEKYP